MPINRRDFLGAGAAAAAGLALPKLADARESLPLITVRDRSALAGVLEVAMLPNETILRGKPEAVARAHALCTEVFAARPVLQAFSADARELEK